MNGWIIIATLSAAAVVATVGAWWGGREWRRGDDIPPGWPLREIKSLELRDALAADIADGTHTLEDGNG